MDRTLRFALAALAALSLAACAPTLHLSLGQLPSADPSVIKPGLTTRAEVQNLFGPPDLEGVGEDGLPTWTYTRATVEVTKARDARLTEFFNLQVTFSGDLVDAVSYDRTPGARP